jgi:hypothetical protein
MLDTRVMAHDPIFAAKKLVNLTEAQATAINVFRYDQRLPSDNEAIRLLIARGLAAAASDPPMPAPPLPTGDPAVVIEPQSVLPVAKSAPTYAEASVYSRRALRPPEGFPWENKSPEATKGLGTDVPERLKVKLRWLSDQFKAAGLSKVTQEKLITDALQGFALRELRAWGVPVDD